MRALMIHGIWSDGTYSVDLLGKELEQRGCPVEYIDLPRVGPWTARFLTGKHADMLVKASQPGDVYIAHSRGCYVAAEAMKKSRFIRHAYMFRPAMSQYYSFEPQDSATCIHSPDDNAIRAGSLLLFHPFGLAGVKGFRSPYTRNWLSTGDHNADFEMPLRTYWANLIWEELQHCL